MLLDTHFTIPSNFAPVNPESFISLNISSSLTDKSIKDNASGLSLRISVIWS